MKNESAFLSIRNKDEIWQRYCGFLELSTKEFMEIQESLLMEQMDILSGSTLAKKLMNDIIPDSVENFRNTVPLTTYEDYAPYFMEQKDEVLAEKALIWVHTSGRSGTFKWIPYSRFFYRRLIDNTIGAFILTCASGKGEVNFKGGERAVCNIPALPYAAGIVVPGLVEETGFRIIPPLDIADKMEFRERIEKGFAMALTTGIDMVGSLTSVLLKMGERFTEQSQGISFSLKMLKPPVLYRLLRAVLTAKLEKRGILPKDLWPVKGVFCIGTDTSLYREQIAYYWGKEPFEMYSATEVGNIAMQSWAKKAMSFVPYCSFLEFIPEDEWLKNRADGSYQPKTVLLDEVEKGKVYEIVATNFHGMPFLRYRLGDLVKIVDLKDEEAGINMPQMVFKARADDMVDIAGFARMDEKTLWQAINATGVKYEDWTIRKEFTDRKPVLHLYIELKRNPDGGELKELLHSSLKAIDPFYKNLDEMLEIKPVEVTTLSSGTFNRYYQEKNAAGYDLAFLKPPHTNASEEMIETLLRCSKNI